MPTIKIGTARHRRNGRWYIIVVKEGNEQTITHDDALSFATKAEADAELERQIKTLGPDYTVGMIQ